VSVCLSVCVCVCVCVRACACVCVAPSLTCACAYAQSLSAPAHFRAHTQTHVCLLGTNADRLLSLWRILGLDVSVHREGRRAMHTSVIKQHTLTNTLQVRRRSSAVIHARQGLSEMAKRRAGGLQRRQGSRCDGQGPVKSHAHARTHALSLLLAHGRVLSLQVNSLSMIEGYVDKLAQGTNFSKVSSAVISCKECPRALTSENVRCLPAKQTAILCEVYAAINNRAIDDPEMQVSCVLFLCPCM
jgi:hypothetical protein